MGSILRFNQIKPFKPNFTHWTSEEGFGFDSHITCLCVDSVLVLPHTARRCSHWADCLFSTGSDGRLLKVICTSAPHVCLSASLILSPVGYTVTHLDGF